MLQSWKGSMGSCHTNIVTLPNLLCFGSLEAGTQSLVLGTPRVGNKGHLNGQLSENKKMHNFSLQQSQSR
jgi:hypothetical protein